MVNRVFSFHSPEHSYNYVKSLLRDVAGNAESVIGRQLLRANDLTIAKLEVVPSDYDDPMKFCIDYGLTKFLSKWKGLKTGIDTKAAALTAFEKQEVDNIATNERLKTRNSSIVDPVLHRAGRLISRILGPFDESRLSGLEDWGPGATTDMSRRRAYVDSKIMNFPIQVSVWAKPYLERAITKDLHWSYCLLGSFPVGPFRMLDSCFEITNFNDIDTVPKTSKTDRTIAIEPRGNMFLQKAVGKHIRRRLKGYGVNLDDQSRNQQLALSAQQAKLATIDLSMASDSVTKELVWLLLPFEWAHYLDLIRSRQYRLPGDTELRTSQKFSSMGNGFTFELESLLFYALVRGTVDDSSAVVAVYGDDIICPQECAHEVICVLNYCGFVVNPEKSFLEGRFFESCGKHYFDGVDVTPIYQKEEVNNMEELIRLQNRIVRYILRCFVKDDSMTGPWVKSWKGRVASLVTNYDVPLLPLGAEGDDGILVNHELVDTTKLKYRRSYGLGWPVLRTVPVRIPAQDAALLALTLRRRAAGIESLPFDTIDRMPFNGSLESRSQWGTRTEKGMRWIDPDWEFALD